MRAIAWSGLTRSDVKYVSVTATPSVLVGLVFIPLELLRPSILTILFLAGLFKNRPEAVPAAIIVDAGLRLDVPGKVVRLWRVNRHPDRCAHQLLPCDPPRWSPWRFDRDAEDSFLLRGR